MGIYVWGDILFIILIFALLIISFNYISNSSKRISEKHNVDNILLEMEKNKNKMDNKILEKFLIAQNDYRSKQNSSRLTSPLWLTRLAARNELETSCEKLNEVYEEFKMKENKKIKGNK